MRNHTVILATGLSLLLAGFTAASQAEPKKESPGAAPSAKAAEPAAPAVDKHSEENLRSRVNYFWKSKISTKYDECYNLLTKKSREKQTMVNYIQRINTRITGYHIDSVTLDPANPNHMKVLVLCKLQALGYKIDNARQSQDWYFEDGDWFVEYIAKTPFDSKPRKPAVEKTAEATKAAGEGTGETADKSGLDPEQKKHLQELIDQLKKSRGSVKPSLNEALAPQERPVKPAAQPAGTQGKASSPAAPATPADGGANTQPEKDPTQDQTQSQHHSGTAEKTSGNPAEQGAAPSGTSAVAPAKQEPAKTGPSSESPAKQDPAKAGKPVEAPAKQDPTKTGTPANQDPAKTGGDPK